MVEQAATHAHFSVVQPGGNDRPYVPGSTATARLTSNETGSIAIVEQTFAPGVLVPPHIHSREDEISYVVAGEMGFRSAGREVTLAAGGYVVKPRGELHCMWNSGTVPARMIEIVSPGGLERYFVELAEAVAAAGAPSPELVAPIAARYGLSFDFSEVDDIAARYGVDFRPRAR